VIRLVHYELLKTFLKKRTYLGFLIILVIVPLIEVAMKIEGGRIVQVWTRSLHRTSSSSGTCSTVARGLPAHEQSLDPRADFDLLCGG